jgi:hypothetical protein
LRRDLVGYGTYLGCIEALEILQNVEQKTVSYFEELGSDLFQIYNYAKSTNEIEEDSISEKIDKRTPIIMYGFIVTGILFLVLTFVINKPLIFAYIIIAPFVFIRLKQHENLLFKRIALLSEQLNLISELQYQRANILDSLKMPIREKANRLETKAREKLGANYLQEINRFRKERGFSLEEAKDYLSKKLSY